MKSKKIIIGTRGSKLALIYAERAKAELKNFFQMRTISCKLIHILSLILIGIKFLKTGLMKVKFM